MAIAKSKTVTISATEDECSSITEVFCEIIFVRAILLFVGVIVEYSITVYIDHVGAISLLENT